MKEFVAYNDIKVIKLLLSFTFRVQQRNQQQPFLQILLPVLALRETTPIHTAMSHIRLMDPTAPRKIHTDLINLAALILHILITKIRALDTIHRTKDTTNQIMTEITINSNHLIAITIKTNILKIAPNVLKDIIKVIGEIAIIMAILEVTITILNSQTTNHLTNIEVPRQLTIITRSNILRITNHLQVSNHIKETPCNHTQVIRRLMRTNSVRHIRLIINLVTPNTMLTISRPLILITRRHKSTPINLIRLLHMPAIPHIRQHQT